MSNKSLPASPRGVGPAKGQRSRLQLSRPNWRAGGGEGWWPALLFVASPPSPQPPPQPAAVWLQCLLASTVCPLGPAGLRPGSQPAGAVRSRLRPQHVKATFPGLPEPGRQGTRSITHSNYRAQGQATRNNREAGVGFPYHLRFMIFQTRTSVGYGGNF